MRDLLLWLVRSLDIFEAGHRKGLMTCSSYEHHRHLPLDLIKWYREGE